MPGLSAKRAYDLLLAGLGLLLLHPLFLFIAIAIKLSDRYLDHCLPRKIALNLQYAATANLWRDTLIILQTLFPWSRPAPRSTLPHAPRSDAPPLHAAR